MRGPDKTPRKRRLDAPNYKHGHTSRHGKSKTFQTWSSMIDRCTNEHQRSWPRYGGRGIAIYERWLGEHGFENFLADMGERPRGKTLDRFPNRDGNYEPTNCRWATPSQQGIGTSVTILNTVSVCIIRHLRRRGQNLGNLAYAFGVSKQHIWRVASQLCWPSAFGDAWNPPRLATRRSSTKPSRLEESQGR